MAIKDEITIKKLLKELLPFIKPLVVGGKNIRSTDGKVVHITFVGLPFTSKMYKEAQQSQSEKEQSYYLDLCQQAVNMLKDEYKVKLVGLGQYSSIIAGNGTKLGLAGIAVTTGNTYTAYSSIEQLLIKAKSMDLTIKDECLGVIGAAGNICSAIATYFSHLSKNILLYAGEGEKSFIKATNTAAAIYQNAFLDLLNVLNTNENEEIVNEGEWELHKWLATTNAYKKIKMEIRNNVDVSMNVDVNMNMNMNYGQKILDELIREFSLEKLPIRPVSNLSELYNCRLVMIATSEPTAFLTPNHFREGAIVCDISVPTNCTKELFLNTKNICVLKGGVIELPYKESLPIMGFPLKAGEAFACISETLLLGMEEYKDSFSYGPIDVNQMRYMQMLAQKHGLCVKKIE